jgi:hypothetical protein
MINSVFVVVDDEMRAIRAFQSEPLEVGETSIRRIYRMLLSVWRKRTVLKTTRYSHD